MKFSVTLRNIFLELICLLFVLLFVYAAVSKLLDFENFQVQLGQSPLISSFAGFISFFIPILELLLAFFLIFPKSRRTSLHLSTFLMSTFSAYIFVMINFSPNVPCSCGGILEQLNWKEHLYFNMFFVILGTLALYIENNALIKQTSIRLLFLFTVSLLSIYVLFHTSEWMKQERNNFTRSFPHYPTKFVNDMDLKFNSYYIAGSSPDKVYLGNYTAPLIVTEIDSSLHYKKEHYIILPESTLKYKSLTLTVDPPYFYVWDGTEAFVYKGSTDDWKASLYIDREAYFTSFVPINKSRASIRAISSETFQSVLGTLVVTDSVKVALNSSILIKQVDGLFDTDGTHLYNKQHNKILYTYYYRNQYAVCDTLLQEYQYGKTIDTTSKAKIKVKYIASKQGSKLIEPAVTVNKRTATYGNYLYIHAGLLGRYEPKENWDNNSIIDVYDFTNNTYQFSFYIDDKLQSKVKDFKISQDLIYTLNGNYIRTYRFKKDFY
ncbi:MauE/DoxX family redox-associated membrane protein [Flavobacterium sp.]|uniref:MauE/DoxX family redox-associated membrane protein n=1 Tax=Flavobacterium sp. TaxID=239 RepID=UPI002FDAB3FD